MEEPEYVVLWETWNTALQKFSYLMAEEFKPTWTLDFGNIGVFTERQAQIRARYWIDRSNKEYGSIPMIHVLLYEDAIIKIAMET